MLRFIIHYGLHFIFPIFIARVFNKEKWKKIYLIFFASMLVDLDHLFSNPIFDPNRLSVGHHPLHSYYALAVYGAGLFYKPTRILSFALIFHMFTDVIDFMLSQLSA
jgi:hypothetical protein